MTVSTVTSPSVGLLGRARPDASHDTREWKDWSDANIEQSVKILASIVNSDGISLASQPSTASSVSVASSGTVVSSASVASAASTATQAMVTHSLKPGILGQNGEFLEFDIWGTHAANGNNKTVLVALDGTTIATTGALAANNKSFHMRGRIVRQSSAVEVAMNLGGMANDAVIVPATTALTKDTSLGLDLVVNASGAAAADVLIHHVQVRLGKLRTVNAQP